MLILLSPSKNLHKTPKPLKSTTEIRCLEDTVQLITTLRKLKASDLQSLMSVNEKIANLNVARYRSFPSDLTPENSTPAITTFSGEVYLGLQAETLSTKELNKAQKTIRILSGLYGLLRPFDLIYPYRLEMGTPLKTGRKNSLYAFWGDKITTLLNEDIEETKSKVVINLASQEYMQAIDRTELAVPVIDIQFLEDRNGKLQFLSYNAKRSRGWMARCIIQEGIKNVKELKSFSEQGYSFRSELSSDDKLVFVR